MRACTSYKQKLTETATWRMKTDTMKNYSTAGFTAIDLIAVLVCISLLGLLALPALAGSRGKSARAGCLSNLRRLQIGAEMYRVENDDTLIPNSPSGLTSGWLGNVGSENWFNSVYNVSSPLYTASMMGKYLNLGNDVSVFRCPGDVVPSDNGFRIRSYSMNGQMGTLYDKSSVMGVNPGFQTYTKGSDLNCPTPANTFVFADESPCSLNDGLLQIKSTAGTFWDFPAAYLEGGCGFSFADGHAEIHQWTTTALAIPVRYGTSIGNVSVSALNADWLWLTQHAACHQ
jgi:prepilin-type processing-associated H-X9-DG protein